MTTRLLELDPAALAGTFPHKPFAYRHGFSDHPLFTLDALVALAAKHPRNMIEWNSGKQTANQDPNAVAAIDLDPADVVRQIETAGAWMVIKHAQHNPEYGALVEEALNIAARAAGHESSAAADMGDHQCFIFISSAGSVTPFHNDPEENFFVHIRGRKFFHVIENKDFDVVSEADMEYYPGKHRNLPYKPEFEEKGVVYDMSPGDGIFVPYLWPHWVRTGTESYAVSMQITFKSPEVRRRNKLRLANGMLRRMGMPQSAPGRAPTLDGVKVAAMDVAKMVKSLRKRERHHDHA